MHKRLTFALAALSAACWILAGVALLAQTNDAPGVTVDLGGAQVMHRTSVSYPAAARAQNIGGTVMVEATLDAKGNVADARVVSGPEELRKGALTAVLDWHFARGAAGATQMVGIRFDPSAEVAQKKMARAVGGIVGSGPVGGIVGGIAGGVPIGMSQLSSVPRPNEPRKIGAITVLGLPDQFKNELLAALPVHAGDTMGPETLGNLTVAVRQFDEHLSVTATYLQNGESELRITAPGVREQMTMIPAPSAPFTPPGAVNVAGNVQAANIVRKVAPTYPPLAKQARIQGIVNLRAVIGADGNVMDLTVGSGHPLLVQSAIEAVRQWQYRPTLVNGQAVPVVTDITVNFTLADDPPPLQ